MERLDLYTGDHVLSGMTIARGEPVPKGYKTLVIFICIFNSEGKMLIQQRQSTKKTWPNLWDVTVGGCVSAGEDSQTAAHRETLEEIGADIDFSEECPKLTIHYEDCMNDVYAIRRDLDIEKLTPQPEEVQCLKWASQEEIIQMLEDGTFIGVYKEFISLMFAMQDRLGILV